MLHLWLHRAPRPKLHPTSSSQRWKPKKAEECQSRGGGAKSPIEGRISKQAISSRAVNTGSQGISSRAVNAGSQWISSRAVNAGSLGGSQQDAKVSHHDVKCFFGSVKGRGYKRGDHAKATAAAQCHQAQEVPVEEDVKRMEDGPH